MADLEATFESIGVYGITMVLSGDVNSASCQVTNRVITAEMAEFEFECPGSQGMGYQLMSQADAHYRLFPDKLLDCFYYIVEQSRVAWAW